METERDWGMRDRLDGQVGAKAPCVLLHAHSILAMVLHQTAQVSEDMEDLYNFEGATWEYFFLGDDDDD